MRSLKSLLMVVVALILVSCSMSAKPEKNETEKASAHGEVIALNKADFLSKVYNYEKNQTQWVYEGNKPAIIDFYADWCGPCKSMSPILKQLKSELQDFVSIIKINVDTNPSLAAKYQVQGVPTFIVFKNGVQTFRQSGMLSLAQLKQVVST